MAFFNRIILAGNLTRNPEIRHLPSGQSVTNFALAVNERFQQGGEKKEHVSFFDCAAYGKVGEALADHMVKGSSVLLEGRLRQRRWDDDRGQKRSKVEVLVDSIRFLGSPRGEYGTGASPSGAGDNLPDDDVPF